MGWDVHGGDPTRAHSLTPKGRCLFVAARERDGEARSPPVHRAGPSPRLQRAMGQPISCLWGRLHYSPGSWLRLAGCGPKAISHSGRPLPLCPFSLLPPIGAVLEAPKQPMSCQLQGQEGTESQEELGPTGWVDVSNLFNLFRRVQSVDVVAAAPLLCLRRSVGKRGIRSDESPFRAHGGGSPALGWGLLLIMGRGSAHIPCEPLPPQPHPIPFQLPAGHTMELLLLVL